MNAVTPPYAADEDTTKVPVGFSEFLGLLASVASFLVALTGQDYGVTTAQRVIASAGPIILPGIIAWTRSRKHQAASRVKAARHGATVV